MRDRAGPTTILTMKQLGLGLKLSTKKTRKREFLEEMERVVPWAALGQIVAPYYPKARTGRPPFGRCWCGGSRHPRLIGRRAHEVASISWRAAKPATSCGCGVPMERNSLETVAMQKAATAVRRQWSTTEFAPKSRHGVSGHANALRPFERTTQGKASSAAHVKC